MHPNPAPLRTVECELLAFAFHFQIADDASPGWINNAAREMVAAVNDAAPQSVAAERVTDLLYSIDSTDGQDAARTFRRAADLIVGWLMCGDALDRAVTSTAASHVCHGVNDCRVVCPPEDIVVWQHWKKNTAAAYVICVFCGHGALTLQTLTAGEHLTDNGARAIAMPTHGKPEWTDVEAGTAMALFHQQRKLDNQLAAVMQKWASA